MADDDQVLSMIYIEELKKIILSIQDAKIKIFDYPSFTEVSVIKTNHIGKIRKIV